MEDLTAACAARGRLADPIVRQRLVQSWIEVEIFRLHNAHTLARLARGEELGSESSLVKLFWANMSQRLYDTAIATLAPGALLMPDDNRAIDEGRWALGVLACRANSIMGGTYPGPGITIGPAIVFAYRAVAHAFDQQSMRNAA